MSACSAFLVDVGALFTEGLYRPHLVPNRQRPALSLGRAASAASRITMLGVLYAMFLIQSVLYTFLLTETLATFVGISVLGGIVWRRANRWGALASLLSALATNFLLYYWPASGWITGIRTCSSPRSLVGIAALVVVSLLTRARARGAHRVVLRAAADVERRRRDRRPTIRCCSSTCCTRGRAAAGRGWRAFREDLGGFAFGWVLVITLVVVTGWWLGS